MKFLIDGSSARIQEREMGYPGRIAGQLLTPLTRYKNIGGVFAIDNGAFSNFNEKNFLSLLKRDTQHRSKCLFVTAPDVVGDVGATRELWEIHRHKYPGWPLAYALQDGENKLPANAYSVFLGGTDAWKDSTSAQRLVARAFTTGRRVHIGRVNGIRRFNLYKDTAHTCDGSGVSRYDHMWKFLWEHKNHE